MQYLKTIVLLLGIDCFLGCKREANEQLDTRFEVPAAGYSISVAASGNEKVDALVRQLVSQRPAPYPSGYSDPPDAVVFADRYSTPEVEAALKGLKEMGPAVFPVLVKHLGDDRYS